MTLILDAGALIAIERGEHDVIALIAGERRDGRTPVTHGGVIGQVWRGGARQAMLSRILTGVEVVALDETLGRRAGVLLARVSGSDVIDAAVVLLAVDGDDILTSDPDDLATLAAAGDLYVDLIPV